MFRIDEPGGSAIPAQLIRASNRPNALTHWSMSALATRSSSAAPITGVTRPPEAVIAATVSSTASGSRPLTTTPAPRLHSSSVTARPIPRLPPDTTTPRPSSRFALVIGVSIEIRCAQVLLDGEQKNACRGQQHEPNSTQAAGESEDRN